MEFPDENQLDPLRLFVFEMDLGVGAPDVHGGKGKKVQGFARFKFG